jgi:hypothetical protein
MPANSRWNLIRRLRVNFVTHNNQLQVLMNTEVNYTIVVMRGMSRVTEQLLPCVEQHGVTALIDFVTSKNNSFFNYK